MVWKNLKGLFHQNNHPSLLAMRNFFAKGFENVPYSFRYIYAYSS